MRKKKKVVAIVGLGYVGFPLAQLCLKKGYQVVGIDINKDKVKKVKKELPKIKATTNYQLIEKANIIVICVPTPVDRNHRPIYKPIISSGYSMTKYLQKGQLVILESTVNPGATEEILMPVLEKSGLKAGENFYLAFCAERIDPGNKEWHLETIPRVVGGINRKSLQKAITFYKSILKAKITPMTSIKAAEAVKIIENTFRDVNIAFVNELAMSFDQFGINVLEVLQAASTKPFAFMLHYPGCGVGGHCIPVDPYYLIDRASKNDFRHQFLEMARMINNSMPNYTVKRLKQALKQLRKPIKKAKVGILGLAYKKNVNDLRMAPSRKIIALLKKTGAKIYTYDPFLPKKSTEKSLESLLKKSDCLILVTDHDEFVKIKPKKFKKNNVKIIIDGRNCLNKEAIIKLNIIYKGIGR